MRYINSKKIVFNNKPNFTSLLSGASLAKGYIAFSKYFWTLDDSSFE